MSYTTREDLLREIEDLKWALEEAQKPKEVRTEWGGAARVLLVNEGKDWFVRLVFSVLQDLDAGQRVYRCDLPIAGPCTLEHAVHEALKAQAKEEDHVV